MIGISRTLKFPNCVDPIVTVDAGQLDQVHTIHRSNTIGEVDRRQVDRISNSGVQSRSG